MLVMMGWFYYVWYYGRRVLWIVIYALLAALGFYLVYINPEIIHEKPATEQVNE